MRAQADACAICGGIAATSTGVGAPAGIAGITLGIPTMGFGGAMIIEGFNGGNRNVPTGPLNAIDQGFGGDGSIGSTLDIFSGGLPKDIASGIIMGYGIYNSGLFDRPDIYSGVPTLYPSVRVDNTNVVIKY